jgi:hypothetical protein
MLRPTERKKVQWSPHNANQFVVGGNDLRLYEIRSSENTKDSSNDVLKHFSVLPPAEVKPHEKKVITLIGAHTEIQSLKCFDWCLDPSDTGLLAVGLATGKVLLANMSGDGDSVKKEFVPRQVRTCNAVAWNPHDKALLATGLDKVRSDFSCLIWDIRESGSAPSVDDPNASSSSSAYSSSSGGPRENSFNLSSIAATEKVEKPIGQFANSEAVASVAWLPGSPGCLATGTGARWLRVYDMRDALKPVNSVGAHSSKAIYGVCVDPHRDHCLATYSEESIVKLWDTRLFKEPVMQLVAPGASANNKVSQIAWCPTRGAGLLGVISKHENFVRVWNVNSGMLIQDEEIAKLYPSSSSLNASRSGSLSLQQPSASKLSTLPSSTPSTSSASTSNATNPAISIVRATTPDPKDSRTAIHATSDIYDTGTEQVSSFSWHPTKGQMLTVSINSVIDIMALHEPIPISFSSQSRLCFSSQKMMLEGPVLMKPFGISSSLASSSTASALTHTQMTSASSSSLSSQQQPLSAASSGIAVHSISSGTGLVGTGSGANSAYQSLNHIPSGNGMLGNMGVGGNASEIAVNFGYTTSPSAPSIDMQYEKDEAVKGKRDMSLVMYERAVAGYGGDAKLNRQLVISFDHPELEYVWNWLNDMKFNLAKKAQEYKGIYAVIMQSKNPQPSKIEETMVFNDPTPVPAAIVSLRARFPVYQSTERQFCLKMCGWGYASSSELATAIETSEQRGKLSRGVALAVFHLDISQALQMLRMNVSLLTNDLKLVSLALTGFADSSSNQWKSVIEPLRSQISDSYLVAVLSFLCATNADYWDVLYETDMSLRDKLAFACRFYDDDRLFAYLERTKVQVIGQGKLTGLLLTGIDSFGGGVDLIQNYIDRTSDLQTATLLLSHISPRKIKDPRNRINAWTHIYRQMLDRWGLWTERAKFDVLRGEANPPPHVMARCNYCNATLTLGRDNVPSKAPMAMGGRGMGGMGGMGAGLQAGSSSAMRQWADKKKISSCPSCRKPLPRCALCLLPMNCIPPSPDNRQLGEGLSWSSGFQNFDDWFSWCQTCKHGGHSGHLADWFKNHTVCPVSDCDCKCSFI